MEKKYSAMKRKFIAGVILGVALLLILNPPVAQRPEKPCIVLMSIDTLRADHLGCYGYPVATSPQIDAFCRESVQFMRACSQAPSTAASHMSLFTGMLPPVHGVTNTHTIDNHTNLRPLSPVIPTLPEILKQGGYLTAGFHGGGYVAPEFGFGRGFDLYVNEAIQWNRLWRNGKTLSHLRSWLARSRREGKPLFLFLHHYLCHDPYLRAPRPLIDRFLKQLSATLPRSRQALPPRIHLNESTPARFWRGVDKDNESHRRQIVAMYDAGVAYSDFVFGRVRRILEEEKMYDRSLVILLSDHGEEFWEHGDILHWRLFRETLHVPLLVKFPQAAMAGKKVNVPVRMFDIMPTLLEYLGIPQPAKMQAASLMPLLREEAFTPKPPVSFSNGFDSVRILDGKLAYSNQPSGGEREWLFDHVADPLEKRNLAHAGHPLLARLRSQAASLLMKQKKLAAAYKARDGQPAGLDNDLRKQLESLGYLCLLFQPDVERLPDGIIIDQRTAVLQVEVHAAQRFVPFQGHDHLGLAGHDQR